MADATVRDIMRTDIPTVAPAASIATVARLMVESGLPGVPVVDDGEIVGIVTEKDLIARQADVEVPTPVPFLDAIFLLDGSRQFDDDLRHVLAVTAGQLMTAPVFNIRASATISQVATLMLEEKINPIPVIDDNLSLIGIVTRADIVAVIARMESESASDQPADET